MLLAPPPAAAQIFPSSAGDLKVETVAGGLVHPWSLAFLPDGRMLVTERPGRMRIVTRGGELSPPLAGVPEVFAQSQAGLMDVILGRDFAKSSHHLFLLRRARRWRRRPHRGRAWAAAGEWQEPAPGSGAGDLPPARPRLERPEHRLPHGASG